MKGSRESGAMYPSAVPGHLIHVGFPKTGSNFLRRWFREHPQLAYVDGGIAGYLTVYDLAREGAAPQGDVRVRVTSSESLTAPHKDSGRESYRSDEPSDPAVGQENVCASLAALFHGAHVLIVTRGFRSMILSSFSQYVRMGADTPLERFVTDPLIGRPWEYDRIIGMYAAAFGAGNVLAMPYELLRDDADRFVRVLEERIGLDHHPVAVERLNEGLTPVELYWYPRLSRLTRRLPLGSLLRRSYSRAIFRNRFRSLAAALQRVWPGTPVTADAIPESLIAEYRTKARGLRDNPLYAPYAGEYYQS